MIRGLIGRSHGDTLPRQRQSKFDATSRLDGKIFGSEKIMMEGQFRGEIIVRDSLEISQNATVNGNIKADSLFFFGKIEGNIETASGLRVGETAQIHGNIKAGTLEVVAGAIINGECSIGEMHNGQETSFVYPQIVPTSSS